MSQLKARCIDQVLTFENTPVITSGDVNYDSITFDFCSAWDGFTKTAIFYRSENEVYYQLLDEANTCIIPREVLTTKGVIHIGVFGVMDDITLTSQVLTYRIAQGAITENLKPADPTPDIYAQILSRYNHYDERLSYFEERFNGSVGDAEFLEGHDADYFATAESVEALKDGTTPAGKATEADDASKLGGKSPDHFATAESVTDIIEGTTPVGKAEDSNKLDGHEAEYFARAEQVDGTEVLNTSILEKALTLETGVYQFKFGGSSYSGNDLPHNSYKYGNATVFVYAKSSNALVVLWGTSFSTTPIATQFYSGNDKSWRSDWLICATTADLANYLSLTGGTVSGASGNDMPVYMNGVNENRKVYTGYKINGTTVGWIGYRDGEPCAGFNNGRATAKLLHEGNSAKVHIGDTAPNDTTALWIDTSE